MAGSRAVAVAFMAVAAVFTVEAADSTAVEEATVAADMAGGTGN